MSASISYPAGMAAALPMTLSSPFPYFGGKSQIASARYIPVTKEVIIWARESRGLDPGTAAKRLKVSEEQLDRWESGLELPMATQFKRMVTLYRRSPAVLMLPFVPL